MEKFCDIRQGKSDKPIIYFIHGYNSNKNEFRSFSKYFNKKGYTTYRCDSRGHGKRKNESSINDFVGTINDYNNQINKNKKDAIIIGMSMGGAEALKIGNENPNVKKVFAISAPHDDSVFDNSKFIKIVNKVYKYPIQRDAIKKIVSKYYTPNKNTDFYFIHDKNDGLVPFDQFEKNVNHFKASVDRTLVYDHLIPINSVFLHVYPIFQRKTKVWIEKKL